MLALIGKSRFHNFLISYANVEPKQMQLLSTFYRKFLKVAYYGLICFQLPLHQEKANTKGLRRGSLEGTDERIAKEKMTKKVKGTGKTMNTTTQGQTKGMEVNNTAGRIKGNAPEVKILSKGNKPNQGTGPAETAATNSGRTPEVYQQTGETGPWPNLKRRPKTKRRRLRLRKMKGTRSRMTRTRT